MVCEQTVSNKAQVGQQFLHQGSLFKGQSHELRMRDLLPLGALTQEFPAITGMDSGVGNMK